MNPILNKNLFLIKEHIGIFKAANNYDIYDPESNEMIMQTREDSLGFFTKMFRFTDYKRMTPFHIEIKNKAGEKIISVKRGITFFKSDVEILDERDRPIGLFKQQLFSIGSKFNIFDTQSRKICTLQGKWTGWDFKFMKENTELAHVSKKWAGIGKEFFTSADNYILKISDDVTPEDPVRQLILAAVMCIDMILKE
ncbi:phospholipid scramblase-related protein [Flavobacterium kingsejongi]|uniref:RNAase n=1 Tax=Flavobacterium kingsejongi TaxID=1678728 RepID=A0A2S1LT56_9FLAO|nr:phospholipid scramblase-related protein [Flavobacterium kingsejongi]AWG26904.1 RNAase [Flavobacterium kingsejongi]